MMSVLYVIGFNYLVFLFFFFIFFFFFKQKTAYEMRISDWSSDVCSSDLIGVGDLLDRRRSGAERGRQIGFVLADSHPADHLDDRLHADQAQIGRASCRERVCQYV